MSIRHKYSVCFQPDNALVIQVQLMKIKLANKIGWYNSKNSLAHLTIAEFYASENEISRIENQIKRCCNRFSPVDVRLQSFDTYSNGTFFLKVEEVSKLILKDFAQQIHNELQLKKAYKCTDPHLSIARKLNSEKIQQAVELLEAPDLYFQCNQIALRKLNLEKKQFDIIALYPFLNQNDNRYQQMSLF